MDEPPLVLIVCRWIALVVSVVTASGCLLRDVVLIDVRNETPLALAVHTRLAGHEDFSGKVHLQPNDQYSLMKYEESWGKQEPASDLVKGIRFVTPRGCVGTLDTAAIGRASQRNKDVRKWIVRLTPETLTALGCPPSAEGKRNDGGSAGATGPP